MKITGKKIMQLLGEKNQTKFIKSIFDPLKLQGHTDVFDSWSVLQKRLYALMSGKEAYSHSTFVTWSEKIKHKDIYNQLIEKIAAYQSDNEEQRLAFRRMFEEDKSDKHMPRKLAEKIGRKFDRNEDCEAILLLFLWSIYREDISLLSFLYTDEDKQPLPIPTVAKEAQLRPHMIPANPIYIRHSGLIQEIHKKLIQGNHFVFLQGMGGVGKTESAKQYAKQFSNQYDTIVFAEYNSSLLDLLNDNTVFTLTKPFHSERFRNLNGMTETDEEFYQRKLEVIRRAVSDRTLLILDNVDTQDPKLEDFLTGICHVIVTTRWQSQTIYPEDTISLNEINNLQECKEIFSAYYGKNMNNDPFVGKMIEYFSGHTLALELTAKQMKASDLSSEEMWDIISAKGESELEDGFLLPNKGRSVRSMTGHILQIFNIAHLNETDRYILSCMSLMPKSGLKKKYVRDFCGLKNYNELNNLIQRSWLRELDGVITMHTLIKETVQIIRQPSLQNCCFFVDKLISKLSSIYCYYADYTEKIYIYNIAVHMYSCFPEPDMDTCKFYEWVELVFSHCNHPVLALEAANKLYVVYQKELGDLHFETARMMCRIGCDERSCNHLDKAIGLIEQGREMLKRDTEQKIKDIIYYELMYLSDVDSVLSSLYLMKHKKSNNMEYLDLAESRSNEMVRIRLQLRPLYQRSKLKSLIHGYCNLAKTALLKKRIETAEQYLQKAEEDYDYCPSEMFMYYIDSGKAEIEIACGNDKQAIVFLEDAFKYRSRYFGQGVSGDTSSDAFDLKIILGKLYEKTKDYESALNLYQNMLDEIRQSAFYSEEIQMLTNYIDHIKAQTSNG